MGNTSSVTIDPAAPAATTAEALLPYYMADSAKFQRIMAQIEVAGRSTKPKFPTKTNLAGIKHVPEAEQEAFKAAHISMTKLKYHDPEAARRMKKVRDLQYERWQWACDNTEAYVNMLRLSGFSDERIQAMYDGTPLCFESPEAYREIRVALKQLGKDIEKEMGWTNVNFIITGSSVPGFSQNPLKGHSELPSKITSTSKSDVDVCVSADGINQTMAQLSEAGSSEPKACFATTCSATTSATRFGCKDISVVCKAAAKFHTEWNEKLPGGLQFTFSEDDNPTPPWEARINTTDV